MSFSTPYVLTSLSLVSWELMKSVRCSSIHSTSVSARIEGEKGVRFLKQCKESRVRPSEETVY